MFRSVNISTFGVMGRGKIPQKHGEALFVGYAVCKSQGKPAVDFVRSKIMCSVGGLHIVLFLLD